MNVQADQAGLGSDPYGTVVSPRPGAGQGRLFSDSVDTATSFADTDQLPAVAPARSGSRGGTGALRIAVVVVALAVVAAGAALGVVKSGVLDSKSGSPTGATTEHSTVTAPPVKGPFVVQTGTGSGSATYSVPVPAYAVTVTTTTGRSWVSIGIIGQHPVFVGILNPGSSQKEILLGPSKVDIGAGGTSVTVTSGKHSTTLRPPTAPFSYQFTTGH